MSPEKELDEFLTSKPAWMQRVLREDYSSFTLEETLAWIERQDEIFKLRKDFERILFKMPAAWKSYCDRCRRNAEATRQVELQIVPLPNKPVGAPRLDSLAEEAIQLKQRGNNYAQIATQLNLKYGSGTTTHEAISKLARRYLANKSKLTNGF